MPGLLVIGYKANSLTWVQNPTLKPPPLMLCATPSGLVLLIFLALLPMLLTFMNKRAGMQSKAEIDFGVFQKYFIFQASFATTISPPKVPRF